MIVHSAEEMQELAATLAADLQGGEVLALLGDLGAGKTTFTQGLAAALGVTARVKSPTFTVMNEYAASRGAIRRIVHADFYRLQETGEVRALSLEDTRRPDTVLVVEWPNAVPIDLQQTHTVRITHLGGDERDVTITQGE